MEESPKGSERPQCNLVMKGGVVSGVVYPLAITQLSEEFQFRGLGGTSAGAIGAAFAAAAQYHELQSPQPKSDPPDGKGKKDSYKPRPGFAGLANLPDHFGDPTPAGNTNLAGLFQAQEGTAPLFALAKALMKKQDGFGVFWSVLRSLVHWGLPFLFLFELVLVVVLCSVQLITKIPMTAAVPPFTLAIIFTALLIGMVAYRRAGELKKAYLENGYGMCRGYEPGKGKTEQGTQLVPWLHQHLQALSGLPESEPLTFAHLEGQPANSELIKESKIHCLAPDDSIQLRMVTTCLSHGRPYTFPHLPNTLYFDPTEMEQLFPKSIVDWLKEHGTVASKARFKRFDERGEPLFVDQEFYKLPKDGLLPVVVAVRMSLAVPFFLSAPSLYMEDKSRTDYPGVLEKVIFTDGGISSNLPIHFFDSLLPTRPTLAINLTTFPVDQDPEDANKEKFGWSATNIDRASDERWTRFQGLFGQEPSLGGFAGAAFEAARSWNDNVQLRCPGFRDRVVDLYLSKEEGGFNLEMDKDQIKALSERGAAAGKNLRARFGANSEMQPVKRRVRIEPRPEPPKPQSKPFTKEVLEARDQTKYELKENIRVTTDWRNHRWTRYRTAMALLAHELKTSTKALASDEYTEFFGKDEELPSYKFYDVDPRVLWNGERTEGRPEGAQVNDKLRGEAKKATQKLVKFVLGGGRSKAWASGVFDNYNIPSPQPSLVAKRKV